MTQRIILVGTTPNDSTGDTLRTAFEKVNDNFTELFNTDIAPIYHLGDDSQFVNIDLDPDGVPTGIVTITSGFNTAMPVYIKGGNALQDGTGGNVIIEAGAPPLAEGLIQDGVPYAGTVGDIELSANQTSIDSLGKTWTFLPSGSLETPDGHTIFSSSNSIGLRSQYGAGLIAGQVGLVFEANGTVNIQSVFPRTFSAVLDTAHMIYPDPAVALDPMTDPWQMEVAFDIVDGQIVTTVEQIFPILTNPGYVTGYMFGFTDADHGIPGYGFSIELQDVVLPGGAGWTANIVVPPAPALPSTIRSESALVLTGDDGIVMDGRITLLDNPAPGKGIYGPSGLSLYAKNGNQLALYWNADNATNPYEGIPDHDAKVVATISDWGGYVIEITTETTDKSWTFQPNGVLALPVGGDIVDSNGDSVLGGGGGGSSYNQSLNTTDNVTFNRLKIANGLHAPAAGGAYDKIKLYDFADNAKINYAIGTEDHHIWMSVDATSAGFKWYGGTNRALTLTGDGTLTLANGVKVDVGTANKFTLDQSTVNYIDLRDVDGRGYYTDSSGYTLRSNGTYSWIFDEGGILNLPLSINGKGVIQTTGDYYFSADGAIYNLGADGVLTVPGDIASIAGVGDVVIESNNGTTHTWRFGATGNLTLPAGGDIVDSTGTSVLGGSSFDQSLNTTNSVTFKTLTVTPAIPGNVALFNGPSSSDKLAIYSDGTPGNGTYIKSLSAIPGEYAGTIIEAAGATIRVRNGGGYKDWRFGSNLHLPAGGDIVDSEGETVLGFASTSYSLSDVLSTILAGANTSGFTVTGDATGTFTAGTELQFESIAGAEFTVGSSSYNSGSNITTVLITDYTGFGPVDGDKIYIEYHGVQEIYAGTGIALGVTEGNSGRVLTIAADITPSVVIPLASTLEFTLGSDFTGTIVGGNGNGAGYIRVESNSGAPNFSPAPISTRLHDTLLTWTPGTQFTVHTVVDSNPYTTVVSFTEFGSGTSPSVNANRNDLYFTRVSGDELPFSYSATELTITYSTSEFSFTNSDVTFPDGTVQNTAWLGSVPGITSSTSTTYSVTNDWNWGDWAGIPSREFNGSSSSTIFFAALKTVQPGDTVVIGGAFGTHTYTIDSVSTDPYGYGGDPASGYFRIRITADQEVGNVNTLTFNIASVALAGNTTIDSNLIINHNIRLKAGADIKNSVGDSVLAGREKSFEIKTSTFVAVSGHRYGINTTGGAITAYLPQAPVVGDAIFFVDSHGTFSNANFTIDGNDGWPYAKTIMGQATQVVTTNNENIGLFYNGAEWRFYA